MNLPERLGSGRTPTRLEQLALENDRSDTRGSAGRMFYELDGDIIVLASGGGTSVEALDNLCLLGGKPAIFTEYSGNPTPEKVKGLTKIALMHPGPIHAIWVVGGRANFTDIYETLIGGIMGGIRETPNFDKTIPILVRRAGPRDEEAFAQLNKMQGQEGYHLFLRGMATSVADSARMVIHQAKKHGRPPVNALIDNNTRVLIQGITGKQGRRVSMEMLDYGTHVVAGVTPGKAGQDIYGVPVYNSVAEALPNIPTSTPASSRVPREGTKDAAIEAIACGKIKLVNILTEGLPGQTPLASSRPPAIAASASSARRRSE